MGLILHATRYRVRREGEDWGRPTTLPTALAKVASLSRAAGGPYRVEEYGTDEIGPELRLRQLLRRLRLRLREGREGTYLLVYTAGRTVEVRKVRIRVRVRPTGGNYLVDVAWTWIVETYRRVELWGTVSCRNVGSTSTPSQHRDWRTLKGWRDAGFPTEDSSAGANAVDVHAPRLLMDAIWSDLVSGQVDRFRVQHAIYWPSTSGRPLAFTRGSGVNPYDVPPGGSDHRDHIHLDFVPTRSGPDRCP